MSKEEILECSFCGRKKAETDLLIAGMDAHICDKCIEQAHGIVEEEISDAKSSNLSKDLTLKKPLEIKDFLVSSLEILSNNINNPVIAVENPIIEFVCNNKNQNNACWFYK